MCLEEEKDEKRGRERRDERKRYKRKRGEIGKKEKKINMRKCVNVHVLNITNVCL